MNAQRPPTDYRATRRKSDPNLALAVVIFLVGVGGTAIVLGYGGGPAAARVGLPAGRRGTVRAGLAHTHADRTLGGEVARSVIIPRSAPAQSAHPAARLA